MDHIAPPGTRNPGFRSKLSALLRTLKIAFAAGIAQSSVLGCSSTPNMDNSVVPKFDLVRFLGKWHEIARFDHPFARGIEEAEATYSLLPNGRVQVLNSGRKRNETRIANAPRLDETDKRSLLDEARRKGYNIEKLIWLNQS